MNMPAGFFLDDTGDVAVMKEYGSIMTWANKDTHYNDSAKVKFADIKRADAFLLAYAKAYGHEIVTQEKANPEKKSNIPIPDAANKIGKINTLTIYELLTKHAKPTFLFKP